ncbi:protein SERAC1 [Leptidea sinapis]|uniref:protein SERAC1 n=1 Tax=Leptidea sinapis TaxID=189913 RepID=UPI0021C34A95|nr:protein SERAC1 [Leptidea sinapis]
MSLHDRLKPFLKILKIASLWGSGALIIAFHIKKTRNTIYKVVNPRVLDAENKFSPEYIYIDDPSYDAAMKAEHDTENRQSVGLSRIWKSLKYSLAWKLLWLCRNGTKEQRNLALEQLAAFKNNKCWDCHKLAQALDKDTAVLLARTYGADLRYFLPPPIHIRCSALKPQLVSFKLKECLVAIQNIKPHSCIRAFLDKYFVNVQEQAMEIDLPSKPDSISEKELIILCLDAIHHHLLLFYNKNYDEDLSSKALIEKEILAILAELLLRYQQDSDIDMAILKVLTVLSIHKNLLNDFFQHGLIKDLSRLLRSNEIRLASSAAVTLANLSGEYFYRPGLYLLYPLYRSTTTHTCDTLLVHGLRGGVFVTWRQRDKKCTQPLGLLDVTVSDVDCDPCESKKEEPTYYDPELQQVMDDIMEMEEEAMLSNFEVVLHDLPIDAKRDSLITYSLTADKKRLALIQEEEDRCNHTLCWPRDWLPQDCDNLRILGVNYWSTLSDWLERCPLQNADIATRATELLPALIDADVGKTNVVWLAHSMGGLIVKQLLVKASQSDNNLEKSLCFNTKALFFYSTPHKGSALAAMPRAAAAVFWPSHDVRQLQENSPTLLDIHNSFIKYADSYGWETISFAETLPTLVTAFKVPIHFVEPNSADLGRGVFYQLPLDHLSICKPATRQSVLYTSVLDVLQRLTVREAEFNNAGHYLTRVADYIWYLFRNRTKQVIEIIDEAQNIERLHWFEKILLKTFTDDFSD